MHSTVRWTLLLILVLLPGTAALAGIPDDYIPEVTDRVARISFLGGDVQIRRADSQDWEVAVLNLPLVEGDEIATDAGGRVEIQFNSFIHLRLDENSQVRITALRDEGIAISVPLGTVSLRAVDLAGSYFEIDAPKTTISVLKPGMYRVEAGVTDSLEVFVTATDGGEARVYSVDAGFTLKNGRRATVYIAGNQAGEWETADASRFVDNFDSWALERDAIIADRLRKSHYDTYYDRDIYGAEDLSDHGDWIHTPDYGYVWRPHQTSIGRYADWSPYRYGHWRWIPPFGWTWVNDEPWGWATYHHGRWVWYHGRWYWTPYGYHRYRRSWWQPALVVVTVYGGNVCWYPLPWRYRFHNYNSHHYSNYPHWTKRRRNDHHQAGGPPTAGNPLPNPAPGPVVTPPPTSRRVFDDKANIPPFQQIPQNGVVAVAASEFGRKTGRYTVASPEVAKSVLSKAPATNDTPPILPSYGDLNGKIDTSIRVARPSMVRAAAMQVRTGAIVRTPDAPLDQELHKTRIRGGRPPLEINTSRGDVTTLPTGDTSVPRSTGAVGRPIVTRSEPAETPVRPEPTRDVSPGVRQRDETVRPEPVRPPRYDPPPTQRPREEPVRPPRNDPPPTARPREEPVRPPRQDPPPPRNDGPRNDPPPKQDPPPAQKDPPAQKEPDKPAPLVERKPKDGR